MIPKRAAKARPRVPVGPLDARMRPTHASNRAHWIGKVTHDDDGGGLSFLKFVKEALLGKRKWLGVVIRQRLRSADSVLCPA